MGDCEPHDLAASAREARRGCDVQQPEWVWLVEGERAADALRRLGVVALGTVTGAAGTPSDKSLSVLRGKSVSLWPDHDDVGVAHMRRIAARLAKLGIEHRLVVWSGASEPGDDAADFVSRGGKAESLETEVRAVGEAPSPLVMMADAIKPALVELDRLHRGDWSRHVRTGIRSLDEKLGGGLRYGEITLVGSPTGGGKTTLVVQFAMAAEERGLAVIVSPEMSARSLAEREIVRRAGYPKSDRAPWQQPERQDIASAAHSAAAAEIFRHPPNVAIYDNMHVTLDEACHEIMQRAKREKIAFVALDYAQQLADTADDKRYLAVGQVAHRAIEIARECDCHVVITSQVNTKQEGKDKRYSFRESAILEQKANNALLFIVEWDQQTRRIESAAFQTTKIRDGAQFRLEVEYNARIFQISDHMERVVEKVVELRDWDR